MKVQFIVVSFLLFTGIVTAQDTIFVKTGQIIPAVITGKNDMEISYKKFGQPEPAAVYSVFISDIKSIHYKDGIIADYTDSGQKELDNKPRKPIDFSGKMGSFKFSFGMEGSYFNRNEADNLLLFWQYHNGSKNVVIGGNKLSYPIDIKMNMAIGNSGRNWIGDELQLIFTPKDAIFATNPDHSNEISLGSFYYNIIVYYGHTVNHKKNLIAIIEPGLNLANMSGYIKLNNTKYSISGNMGAGYHLALGTDWIISKRFMASLRVGQRFLTIKESHKSSSSSTGYSNFYVNPTINKDLLNVKWNGLYASAGLSWSFYAKMSTGKSK